MKAAGHADCRLVNGIREEQSLWMGRYRILVESVRTSKGPRQRTIMQLGKISIPRDQWPILAGVLEQDLSGQAALPALPAFEDNLITLTVRKTAERAITHYCFSQYRKAESKQRKEQRPQFILSAFF